MIISVKFTKTLLWTVAFSGLWASLGTQAHAAPPINRDDKTAELPKSQDKKALDRRVQERKTHTTPALREWVYNILGAAQKAAEQDDYSGALKILEADLGTRQDRLNSYEKAQYYKFKAFLLYSQENYDGALTAYQNVLRQEKLPAAIEDSALYNMAQLYAIKQDFHNAITMMSRWMDYQEGEQAAALMFIGQGYYALGMEDGLSKAQSFDYFRQAIPFIQRAIALYKKTPENNNENNREKAYLLLRAIYFQRDETQKLVDTLEILVAHWPKKDYWIQLSSLYGQIAEAAKSPADKSVLEKKQLATYEVAYTQGLLDTEAELIQMAQLYRFHGEPYWGSVVLESGIRGGIIQKNAKNYERLAQSRLYAQDLRQSLEPLRAGAELSENGLLYQTLGQVYMRLYEYDKAVAAFNLALKKGGCPRPDRIAVYLGMSYFHLKALGEARKSLELAAQDSRSRALAQQWLSYLGQEKNHQELVHEFLN